MTRLARNTALLAIRIGIAVVLLGYLVFSDSIDWSSLAGLVTNWPFTLAALTLFIATNFFLALRLRLLMNAESLFMTYSAALKLTFIGLFFNSYLPGATGGDLVKIYYAGAGNTGKRTEVTTVVLFDRAIGFFALLVLPVILAPLFSEMVFSNPILQGLVASAAVISTGLLALALTGAMWRVVSGRLLNWAEQSLPLGHYLKRIVGTVYSYRHRGGTIAAAVLISFIVQLLNIGVLIMIAEAVLVAGAKYDMVILIPLGYLANTLPVTPGGLGVGEIALETLFALFGLQGGAETLLGWRALTLLTSVVGLYYYLRGQKRFVFSSEGRGAPD